MIKQQSHYGYFNNNNKGFDKPHTLTIDYLNVKIEIYSNNLKASKIPKIESDIKETVNKFTNFFKLNCNDKEAVIKIYAFNDRDDYEYLGGSRSFSLGLGQEGGKFYPNGPISGFPEIYVYQQGNVCNLKHELTHALTHLATNGKSLPTVLSEGIADYLEHHSDYKFNSQGSSIDITKNKNFSLSEILKLEYSVDSELNSLVYKTGHALVMYLQEKDPSLLKNLINSKHVDNVNNEKCLNKIIAHEHEFKHWLDSNNTESAMQDINALRVTKGEFIETKDEIMGGEIKNVSYYQADINKMDGEDVGSFSPVEHIACFGYTRATNNATGDYFNISQQYNFLKVIKNSNEEYKLIYCDKQGNDYRGTEECKTQIFKIISNHDEQIKRVVEKFNKIEKQYAEKQDNIDADYEAKYKLACEKFTQQVNDTIDNLKNYPQTAKILEELLTIDLSLIKGNIPLQECTIFSLKTLGSGIASALSIYDENNAKVGELLSEVGFFKQIEGQSKDIFVFKDSLQNMHIQQDGGTYIGITRKNDGYKASFIDGREVNSDEYYNQSHLHANELLNPSIQHIKAKNLDSLQLKNIDVLSHKDSKFAQYTDEQRKNGVVTEKGKLLDDKGTDRTDDDVYEAEVKQGSNHMHTFKNVGFYISETIRDANGKVIDGSDLLIHDYGKNIRFQLPESITHLKLMKHEGKYKLVPCTKDGNENPEGMPDISDEYRCIDPIFAHQYEKRDYSHQHVNIGLINFDKYRTGTLFSVKFDPNDYTIPKNSDGEIIRINDKKYFTNVKLFHDNEEIGMLSNNFHNFKGKLFFSADYNYSYNDFLASTSPQIHIENMQDGSKRITFDQGKGDIEGTDRGYTDHQKVFFRGGASSASTETREFTKAKGVSESKKESSEKQLFPNKECLTIDDSLVIEIKYGDLANYTLDDVKQTIRAAYGVWCNKFYQQKNDNNSTVKLQLCIFKDCDDYKKYIKEFSGKNYDELCDGGTIGVDEADGTIAKTFVFVNAEKPSSAKCGYIMEKMNDAFLEYAIGDFNKVPDVLRAGMKFFISNYNLSKNAANIDARCIKEAYDKMQSSNLYDMAKDYRVADCLVTFLQEKDPHLISNLLNGMRLHKLDIKTELEKILHSVEIENGFKEWMAKAVGYKGAKTLLPHSKAMLLTEDEIEVNIKYDAQKLNSDKLNEIKDIVKDTIEDGNAVFNINHLSTMPGQVNLYICDTKDEFKNIVEGSNVSGKSIVGDNTLGITRFGYGSHLDVYVYLKNPAFTKTLKHELGHALTIINFDRVAHLLPDAIHEGIAQYVANRENGSHENDHVDIKALSTINDENLRPDEIFNNNYRGKHYYSEAEQVIKFLEDRHPDLIDRLIKDLSRSGTNITYVKELIENFIKTVKNYGSEFSEWVKEQINGNDDEAMVKQLPYQDGSEETVVIKDTILKIQKSHDQDSQGRHKVCIAIDYNDMKSLYDKVDGTEKCNVLEFWHKLHKSDYKVGILPTDKYHFESDMLIVNGKQYSEDKVSVKIVQLGDDYSIVLTNSQGKTISNISKDNINSRYGPEFSDLVTDGKDVAHTVRQLPYQERQEETVVIKDTILKIQKSHDQDLQGKHKACIVIDRNDIESLYNKAEETEKRVVSDLWNKLHKSGYKVGILPSDKYHFENGMLTVNGKQYSEDKVSVKIMKLGDDYSVVLTNMQGRVISSIDKNSISSEYEVLDNLPVINEYDLYLTNGLDMVFNNTHDYSYDLI